MSIRILLADDHAVVRDGLRALLDAEPGMEVVGSVADGREAVLAVKRLQPDVVVMDINMPGLNGIEATRSVLELQPPPQVLILSMHGSSEHIYRALQAGARGYLLKDRPAAELAAAVRRVRRGERVIDPDLAAEAWASDPDPLTERERQILWRAGEGRSGAEIAAELSLSEGTVRNYLSEAISKLGAANRIEAARIARQKGWL